ncbi:MAG: TlpA disulfide reductase family protein [Chitinophagaceae bacterium]
MYKRALCGSLTLLPTFLYARGPAFAAPVVAALNQGEAIFSPIVPETSYGHFALVVTAFLNRNSQPADTIKTDTARLPRPSASSSKRYPLPLKSRNFKNGQLLKFFQANDIQEELFSLKAARGNIVVMNFWFIRCTPCRREMPELNALVAQYQNNPKVQFISIALDQRKELEEFLAASPFSYKVIGNGRALANAYGVLSYPTHVVADSDGRVAFHSVGYAPETGLWLRRTIDRLLQKELVHP